MNDRLLCSKCHLKFISDARHNYCVKSGLPDLCYECLPYTSAGTEWRNNKPSKAQIEGALKKAFFREGIVGKESLALEKEIESWTAGIISDYIGNKIDLDEARKLVKEHAGE